MWYYTIYSEETQEPIGGSYDYWIAIMKACKFEREDGIQCWIDEWWMEDL